MLFIQQDGYPKRIAIAADRLLHGATLFDVEQTLNAEIERLGRTNEVAANYSNWFVAKYLNFFNKKNVQRLLVVMHVIGIIGICIGLAHGLIKFFN